VLAATPDARLLLAARPLGYERDTARVLLRVLDAADLSELARDEAAIAEWSATRAVLTAELEVLALRAAPDGGLALAHVAGLGTAARGI
jgi:hypothetical protein